MRFFENLLCVLAQTWPDIDCQMSLSPPRSTIGQFLPVRQPRLFDSFRLIADGCRSRLIRRIAPFSRHRSSQKADTNCQPLPSKRTNSLTLFSLVFELFNAPTYGVWRWARPATAYSFLQRFFLRRGLVVFEAHPCTIRLHTPQSAVPSLPVIRRTQRETKATQ